MLAILCSSLFIQLIQMILPSGNMKKYVTLVGSMLLLLVIISPIVKFFHNDLDISQLLEWNESLQLEIENKKYEEKNTEDIMRAYQKNIEKGIIERLENAGYEVHQIEIKYDEFTMEPKELLLEIESSTGKVQPVRIEVSATNSSEKTMISGFEILALKSMLTKEYGFERIEING